MRFPSPLKPFLCVVAPTALFAFVALAVIFNGDVLWEDEFYTIFLMRENASAIIAEAARDVHPPLFYFLAKAWTFLFGESISSMEILSLIPVLLTMLIAGFFLLREFSAHTALLFLATFNASGTILHYATEIRMYSTALLLVTCNAICAYYILAFPSNQTTTRCNYFQRAAWLGLPICSVAAAYTHYYAGALVAILDLFLFAHIFAFQKDKIKRLLISGVVTVVLFLPWATVLFNAFSNASAQAWWRETSLTTDRLVRLSIEYAAPFFSPVYIYRVFAWFPHEFAKTGLFLAATVAIVFVAAIVFFLRRPAIAERRWFFSAALLSTPILLYLLMVLYYLLQGINLMTARYFFPGYGLLWMFFAIQVTQCKRARIYSVTLVFFCLIWIFVTPRAALSHERERNTEYNTVLSAINRQLEPTDIFLVQASNMIKTAKYNYPRNGVFFFDTNTLRGHAELRRLWSECAKNCGSHAAWVFLYKNLEYYPRFQAIVGPNAVPVFAAPATSINYWGEVELYRISPSEKLRKWCEDECARITHPNPPRP